MVIVYYSKLLTKLESQGLGSFLFLLGPIENKIYPVIRPFVSIYIEP